MISRWYTCLLILVLYKKQKKKIEKKKMRKKERNKEINKKIKKMRRRGGTFVCGKFLC